jgi:hypothetical protein
MHFAVDLKCFDFRLPIFFVVCACSSIVERVCAQAEDRQSASAAMTARVDALLDQRLAELGWQPAGPCSDAAFLRRASLDLTGAPPTASEAVDFIRDPNPQKRDQLIERLLASPANASHLAQTWAAWMLPEQNDFQLGGGSQGLETWLRQRFAENLRYDRLVADLLVATGPAQNGPTIFFVSLEGKPEKIAAKTARVFLGLQLDCAECHDHPFDDWSQRDFWGFAAYFGQLSINADGPMLGTGEVTDTDQGEVTLPGTEQVVPPSPLVMTGLSELGTGTRRQQLALWLTARENPYVARAAVNRVWSLLFGRGLIEPVDDMRKLELASHPQLLSELSDYFASTGYDLQELLRMLARTDAYGRGTVHESGQPPEASYAVMATKPLTETQMANSLEQIARQIAGADNAALQTGLARQLGKLRGDGSEAKLGIVSALVALHGDVFDQISRDGQSRLLKALEAPYLDQAKQLRWLYLSTLAREPSVAEMRAFSELLSGSSEVSQAGGESNSEEKSPSSAEWQSDLLWALINSTEFAMTP